MMYKMLIAEDQKTEQEVILFLLRKFDFPVEPYVASNGSEAMGIAETVDLDILFTDIEMPYMDGLTLAKKAKERNPELELIFFSGYDNFDYVKGALFLQAVNYILKPVKQKEFQQTLRDAISRLDSRRNAKEKEDIYLKDYFFQISKETVPVETIAENEADTVFLNQIKEALATKNAEMLLENVGLLLDKYRALPKTSHIYMRYLATSIMQSLTQAQPDITEEDFQAIAMKIYSFRHFSDLEAYIRDYTASVASQISRARHPMDHAVHLAKQYIHSHYQSDLTLNTLADIVYLSPKYLSRIFTQATGITISKYIKNVRMEKAAELLRTTNQKISDISTAVGYSNVSYFCKNFQETYQVTPEKYRSRGGKS